MQKSIFRSALTGKCCLLQRQSAWYGYFSPLTGSECVSSKRHRWKQSRQAQIMSKRSESARFPVCCSAFPAASAPATHGGRKKRFVVTVLTLTVSITLFALFSTLTETVERSINGYIKADMYGLSEDADALLKSGDFLFDFSEILWDSAICFYSAVSRTVMRI